MTYKLKTDMTVEKSEEFFEKEKIFEKYGFKIKEWWLRLVPVDEDKREHIGFKNNEILELREDFKDNFSYDDAVGLLYEGDNHVGYLFSDYVQLEKNVEKPSGVLFEDVDLPEGFVPHETQIRTSKDFSRNGLDETLRLLNENLLLWNVKVGQLKQEGVGVWIRYGEGLGFTHKQQAEITLDGKPSEVYKRAKEALPELKSRWLKRGLVFTCHTPMELKGDFDEAVINISQTYDSESDSFEKSQRWIKELPLLNEFAILDNAYPDKNEISLLRKEDSCVLKANIVGVKRNNKETEELTIEELAQKTANYWTSLTKTAEKLEATSWL